MRDFQLNFLFNLGSHTASHGTPVARMLSIRLPRVERKAALQDWPRTATVSCPSPFNPFFLSKSFLAPAVSCQTSTQEARPETRSGLGDATNLWLRHVCAVFVKAF